MTMMTMILLPQSGLFALYILRKIRHHLTEYDEPLVNAIVIWHWLLHCPSVKPWQRISLKGHKTQHCSCLWFPSGGTSSQTPWEQGGPSLSPRNQWRFISSESISSTLTWPTVALAVDFENTSSAYLLHIFLLNTSRSPTVVKR